MKLRDIFLFEYKGDKLAQIDRGYIHSRTAEILPSVGGLPHSSIVATHPEKFNMLRRMQEELPRREELESWSYSNDEFAGPWQHVAYAAGWVRFNNYDRYFNFSGYPDDVKAMLAMPGVIRTIVNVAREYGTAEVAGDIIVPNYSSIFDSFEGTIKTAGDVARLKDQIK